MNNLPKISVIMPVYNGEAFVNRAIESVLNQTIKDFEFIVVDDGSTDGTPHILKQFSEKIKIFSQVNSGPYIARNLALGHARGEYIAFIDADDVWLPERLASQIPLLDKNPKVGLVFGNGIIKDIRSIYSSILPKTFFGIVAPVRGWVFSKLVFEKFFIPQSSVLVRSKCFKELGPFLEIPLTADYHKWLQISLHYQIDFVDDVIFEYTVHGKNISLNRLKKLESLLMVFNNLIDSASDLKITRILQKRHLQIEYRLALAQIYHGVLSLYKNLNTSQNGFSRIQRLVYLGQVIYDKLKSLIIKLK